MPLYSSLAIANEFIERGANSNLPVTQMHLQKLLYIAHGWNLAIHNKALVEDPFEAWEYGPVVRKLYDAVRRYGRSSISKLLRWGDDTDFPFDDGGIARANLTNEERAIVDKVWATYGHLEAFKLSALTHADRSPWARTYVPGKNRPIENNLIQDYFVELALTNRAA